jgi:hypothetical protein
MFSKEKKNEKKNKTIESTIRETVAGGYAKNATTSLLKIFAWSERRIFMPFNFL